MELIESRNEVDAMLDYSSNLGRRFLPATFLMLKCPWFLRLFDCRRDARSYCAPVEYSSLIIFVPTTNRRWFVQTGCANAERATFERDCGRMIGESYELRGVCKSNARRQRKISCRWSSVGKRSQVANCNLSKWLRRRGGCQWGLPSSIVQRLDGWKGIRSSLGLLEMVPCDRTTWSVGVGTWRMWKGEGGMAGRDKKQLMHTRSRFKQSTYSRMRRWGGRMSTYGSYIDSGCLEIGSSLKVCGWGCLWLGDDFTGGLFLANWLACGDKTNSLQCFCLPILNY